MNAIIEFIKRGFYYMWKMDLIIFLVIFIGILLLFLFAWIYGKVRKFKKFADDKETPKNP